MNLSFRDGVLCCCWAPSLRHNQGEKINGNWVTSVWEQWICHKGCCSYLYNLNVHNICHIFAVHSYLLLSINSFNYFSVVTYCYLQLPFWIELKYCWRAQVDHCWIYAILFIFPQTETSAEPSLQAKQLKLKRARLADDLNEKIAQRPGPMELVEKNILPVESSLKEAIIGKVRGGSLWRAFPTCGCDYLSIHLHV